MTTIASKIETANTGIALRTYRPPINVPSTHTGWKIWEAACATSAAPGYFQRFKKAGSTEEYVDGGLGFNNPVHM
jgi:patatin-like phospholipase/acyl hydrolase